MVRRLRVRAMYGVRGGCGVCMRAGGGEGEGR